MSFDRVDSFSAGYGRQGPLRPNTPPNFAGKPASDAPWEKTPDFGVPLAGALNQSFTKQWAQSTATYGSHSLAAEVINRAASPDTALGKKIQSVHNTTAAKFETKPTTATNANINNAMAKKLDLNTTMVDAGNAASKSAVSYSELLHLGNKQAPIHKLSWDRFSGTVKSNLKEFGEHAKPENIKNFFYHTSAKDYVQRTVIAGNIQPIKELATNKDNRQIGTGILRTFAMSFLGYDVIKHTYQTYKNAKKQEDGSFQSKLHTYKETAKSFGKYITRDGTSWEVAGLGAAIGKAVLPLAIGGVSAGGVLLGALAGLLAEKGMDKLLHTGEHDPNQPVQNKAGDEGMDDGNDGSRGGGARR